jgi:hypothetical protein|tara:strand:- start:32 stop:214 length:183 start_codon:yes stop_codon:yes gene_type:complete
MAIYADCESKRRARKKYYDKEENREKKRIYMRSYKRRPEVKARKHEQYLQKKIAEYYNEV